MFDTRLSLKWPKTPQKSKVKGRVQQGHVDMQFDQDNIRTYVPSQTPFWFRECEYETSPYRLELTPLAQPLLEPAVSEEVLRASSAIRIHFANADDSSTWLGSESRNVIRRLAHRPYSPHCYVWRLAAMYLAAAWAEASGGILKTFAGHIPEVTSIDSLTAFNEALLSHCYNNEINPIVIMSEDHSPSPHDNDDIRALLPILSLAASPEPAYHAIHTVLPSVASQWPDLGACELYFCGSLAYGVPTPDLTKHNVYRAASAWCSQNGCHDLFLDYIDTIAVLWTSRESHLAPIFETGQLRFDMPKFDTMSTIVLPLCQPPPTDIIPQKSESAQQIFCRGVNTRLALTLLCRTAVSPGALPTLTDAQTFAWRIGYGGGFGPLLNLRPIFPDKYSLDEWWEQQHFQLQEGRAVFPSICRKLAYLT